MRFRPTIRSAFFACMLSLLGCQRDPYAHTYTTSKPTVAEVAGTYELTKQTVTSDGFKFLNGKRSVVELNADGTCQLENYPSGIGGNLGKLVSGKGKWQIDEVGSIQFGHNDVKPHWGIRFTGYPEDIMPLGLTGAQAPFGGAITYGDPDSGTVAFFTKAKLATK